MTLRKLFRNNTENMIVECTLVGRCTGYDSSDSRNIIKRSYPTRSSTGSYFPVKEYTKDHFDLIDSICNSNSLAIINTSHEDKFIRELARVKLLYKYNIKIKEKTIGRSQRERCMY